MKRYNFMMLLSLSSMNFWLPTPAAAIEVADVANVNQCLEQAQTQSAMNSCQNLDFKQADAELNRVYQQLQLVYQDNPQFLAKLKQSQRTWIKLRDADLAMRFPAENTAFEYGSVYPMCYAAVATELTTQRISFLKQWLSGIEEGDVCSGSVKTPAQLEAAKAPEVAN